MISKALPPMMVSSPLPPDTFDCTLVAFQKKSLEFPKVAVMTEMVPVQVTLLGLTVVQLLPGLSHASPGCRTDVISPSNLRARREVTR